jgi:glycosyltransferase involved in cell wall biosynthesis
VVLLSDKLYEDVSSVVMRNQISIIPNGIPDINFSEYPTPHNTATTFLFLSHLYRDKGISILLNACRQLVDEDMSFKLLIIGGETADYSKDTLLAEIERVGISDYVTYLGALYGEDKKKVWRQSDVFVFPTLKETFGLVLCESLQRGIPCLASDEGGISDILIDGVNGYLFEKGNEEQLAMLMRRCIMNPEGYKSLRQGARASYEEKYSANIFQKSVLNLIKSI